MFLTTKAREVALAMLSLELRLTLATSLVDFPVKDYFAKARC